MAWIVAGWVLWCILHSALASPRIKNRIWGSPDGRSHRIAYNLIAVITLLPLLALTRAAESPPLWRWSGWWRVGSLAMSGAGLLLFVAGARRYDMRQFLGLGGGAGAGIAREGALDTGGVLGVVRHPWYLGGLLLIWARDQRLIDFAITLVLSAYFVAGAYFEEHRLLRVFGDRYLEYQRRVPMFLPLGRLRRPRPLTRERADSLPPGTRTKKRP